MEYTILARNIRTLRRREGLTQEAFAALLGVRSARVIHIECGKEPSAEEVAAICRVLEVAEEVLRCEMP